MIPYFQLTTILFGPLTLNVWGLLAAIGFLVGAFVAGRRARAQGMDGALVWDAMWQVVVVSLLGSRLFEVFFYEPRYYWQHPQKIVAFWDGGLSSTGGIIFAGLFLYWFIKKQKLPLLPWLDIFAYAAPLGIMFGRIGCFFIHDHPGTLTSFIGGVRYSDGIRHDGGLEMAIADAFIFFLFFLLRKKKLPPGFFAIAFIGLKGLARFTLDFFRATDIKLSEARYAGLTPSQYAGLLAVVVIIYWHARSHQWLSKIKSATEHSSIV